MGWEKLKTLDVLQLQNLTKDKTFKNNVHKEEMFSNLLSFLLSKGAVLCVIKGKWINYKLQKIKVETT